MAMFNSYVSLPDGIATDPVPWAPMSSENNCCAFDHPGHQQPLLQQLQSGDIVSLSNKSMHMKLRRAEPVTCLPKLRVPTDPGHFHPRYLSFRIFSPSPSGPEPHDHNEQDKRVLWQDSLTGSWMHGNHPEWYTPHEMGLKSQSNNSEGQSIL